MPVAHIEVDNSILDIYAGEHALHVLAVNRRETELVRLLNVAYERLPRADLELQAVGSGENAYPMMQSPNKPSPSPKHATGAAVRVETV